MFNIPEYKTVNYNNQEQIIDKIYRSNTNYKIINIDDDKRVKYWIDTSNGEYIDSLKNVCNIVLEGSYNGESINKNKDDNNPTFETSFPLKCTPTEEQIIVNKDNWGDKNPSPDFQNCQLSNNSFCSCANGLNLSNRLINKDTATKDYNMSIQKINSYYDKTKDAHMRDWQNLRNQKQTEIDSFRAETGCALQCCVPNCNSDIYDTLPQLDGCGNLQFKHRCAWNGDQKKKQMADWDINNPKPELSDKLPEKELTHADVKQNCCTNICYGKGANCEQSCKQNITAENNTTTATTAPPGSTDQSTQPPGSSDPSTQPPGSSDPSTQPPGSSDQSTPTPDPTTTTPPPQDLLYKLKNDSTYQIGLGACCLFFLMCIGLAIYLITKKK
jgi:hypothetical protein